MAVFVSPNKKSVAKFWEKRQKGTFSRTKVNEIDTCIRFISTFHVTRCFFLLVYFVTTKSNQKGTKTDPSKMSLRPSVRFCTLFWPFSHSFLPVFASFSARFLPPLPPIFCTLCRYFFAFLHLVEVDLPHLAVAAVVHVLAAVGPHLHSPCSCCICPPSPCPCCSCPCSCCSWSPSQCSCCSWPCSCLFRKPQCVNTVFHLINHKKTAFTHKIININWVFI